MIELLVVVAIMGILASLLLPALSKAKLKADGITCTSQLRQIGMAFRMYVDDRSDVAAFDDGLGWEVSLEKYLGPDHRHYPNRVEFNPRGIRTCPSYGRLRSRSGTRTSMGYAWNVAGVEHLRSPHRLNPGPMNLFISSVASPSDLIAVGDGLIYTYKYADPKNWDAIHTILSPRADASKALWPEFGVQPDKNDENFEFWRKLTKQRHRGRFNIVFSDGHVESLKPQNLVDFRRDEVLRRWFADNRPNRSGFPASTSP